MNGEQKHQMKIFIVRHGETAGNKKALLLGRRTDSPLNENGIEQGAQTAQKLKDAGIRFDRILSSPLIRARETARILTGQEPEIDERLIEMDCGPYEGADLKNIPEELAFFFSDFIHHPAPRGMESLDSICARAAHLLEDLKTSPIDGNILLSTHAIAMKGLLEVLDPSSQGSYWSKYIANCAIYTSELIDGTYTVPIQFL